MNKGNIFDQVNKKTETEEIIDLLKNDNIRIERIISTGQSSPDNFWYEQTENEWVIVLNGCATLEFPENELIDLNAGDYVFIPSGLKHRINSTSSTEATIWLAVFFSK